MTHDAAKRIRVGIIGTDPGSGMGGANAHLRADIALGRLRDHGAVDAIETAAATGRRQTLD
jgi:hypothetical protein